VIELTLQIINILVPSVLLAFIGLAWSRSGVEFPVEFVTRLVLNLAMPALLFHTLANSTVAIVSLRSMAMATLVVHVLFAGVVFVLLTVAKKDWRLSVPHVVGNTGNLGLPVCFLAFGEEGLAYAITFFSVQCLLLFSIGDAIFAGSINWRRVLSSPILHSVWLGVVVRMLDVTVPPVVQQSLELLGQIVIPLMLITLGVSLASMRAAQLPSTVLWSFIRTVIAMCVAVGVAHLLGLSGVARGILIIQSVVPVAVFNYLLAIKYNRDSSEVSGMILITHLAAIVYIPMVLAYVL